MPAQPLTHRARPEEITLKSVFLSFDYGFTQRLIRAFAIVGAFGQIAFYFLCSQGFGMRESLPVRLLCSALFAGGVFLPTDRPLRRFEKLYWEVTANISVVASFAYLFILNDMNTYWYISLMFGALAYAFLARPLVLVIFLPVGLAVPTLLWSVSHSFSSAELLRMGQAYATCLITGAAMVTAATSIEWSFRRIVATEASLRETQERLLESEKRSALGRLLAQFSHEINNPVNVIKNNIQPMREYVAALTSMLNAYRVQEDNMGSQGEALRRARAELDIDFIVEDFSKALDATDHATVRIEAVQSDLRTFMGLEAPAWTPTHLNALLKETVLVVQRDLPEGVTIHAEYGDIPAVICHADRITQVFLNLIQNAIDAVGEKGKIVMSTRSLDGGVRFEISNTGPPIPEGIRRRIFEPFFTTKEVGKGTGLGLAVCRRIVVDDHVGTLEIDDEVVDGVRFVVVLPTAPRSSA
ncbi:MAG: HAMP domain-containing histidine kinase [Myxococcota bacterium]|nr:HAMP domain-containing histidine kinase [Myxococcota bacterium]